jgi:hypothetical protein
LFMAPPDLFFVCTKSAETQQTAIGRLDRADSS